MTLNQAGFRTASVDIYHKTNEYNKNNYVGRYSYSICWYLSINIKIFNNILPMYSYSICWYLSKTTGIPASVATGVFVQYLLIFIKAGGLKHGRSKCIRTVSVDIYLDEAKFESTIYPKYSYSICWYLSSTRFAPATTILVFVQYLLIFI